jgi:hypothetical protein
MRVVLLAGVLLVVSLGLWSGCLGRESHTRAAVPASTPARVTSVRVESGTPIRVALRSRISAQTARPGDAWDGWMAEHAVVFRAGARRAEPGAKTSAGPTADAVVVFDEVEIPAGSHVTGVVTAAPGDTSGPWAMPVLAVKAIDVRGRTLSIRTSTGQVVAGSPRARGPGAPAGTAGPIVLRFTVDEIVDLR